VDRTGPLWSAGNMLLYNGLSDVGWMCMQPVESAAWCAQTRRVIVAAAMWT
jgi:hypothetical protein